MTQPVPSDPAADPRPEFRLTPQRRIVYDVVLEQRDHPTASDVFVRVKERMPGISLATVYNCLETLTHSGLIRQVNFDREPSRYCPNLKDHAHFHCEACGTVIDVDMKSACSAGNLFDLPAGCTVSKYDVVIRGQCPACAARATVLHN